MEKQLLKWGTIGFGVDKWFSICGTEIDKQFIEAVVDFDTEKMNELLTKGASINIDLIVEQDGKILRSGTMLYHLLCQKPRTTSAGKQQEIGRLKKRINDGRISGRPTSHLSADLARARESMSREKAETEKHNEERCKDILEVAEFLLSKGAVINCSEGGRLDLSSAQAGEIKFGKVAEFINRANQIDHIVLDAMRAKGLNGVEIMDNYSKYFLNTATKYRNSTLALEEIEQAVKNERITADSVENGGD